MKLFIYPTDVDDACQIIGEAVAKFNGEFVEKSILGMVRCEAIFLNEDDVEAVIECLTSLKAVSHVDRA